MLVSIRFLDYYEAFQTELDHVMAIGAYLSEIWPSCETFKELVDVVVLEGKWVSYNGAGADEPVCCFELNDDSDVMLVFNQNNPLGIRQFRDYLYGK